MGWNGSQDATRATTLEAVLEHAALLEPRELVELLARDQVARWQRGERILAEDYLELSSVLKSQAEAACDLIYGEFLLREEHGESPSLDDYLGRFPQYADSLRELHKAARLDDLLPWVTCTELALADTEEPVDSTLERFANDIEDAGAGGARYRVVRRHSKGGLGEIYIAADKTLHREVALKEIRDQFVSDRHIRSRFVQEAEITGSLEHPGIVPVYTLGYHPDGRPYYVMRFIRGESLRESALRYHKTALSALPPGERLLTFRRLLGRFQHVCDTIAYAHSRGILHRDLKPENIMLGEFGETLVVDWGLAKRFRDVEPQPSIGLETDLEPQSAEADSRLTRSGQIIGSPAYMSPEQAAGRLDLLGPVSDVYSLGATLYFLLTGRAPFEGYQAAEALLLAQCGEFVTPRHVQRGVDPALEAICLKAMAIRPENRYASAQALSSDLESWLADEPVTAYREGWSRRLARLTRRYRTSTQTAAASLLIISVVSIAAAVMIRASWRKESQALNSSLQLSTRLGFDRALTLFDRGQATEGMLWLTRALRTAPDDAADWRRVIRANLANWQGSIVPLRHVIEHGDEVYTVAFSPDGKKLVSGSRDGTARIWAVATGTLLTPALKHNGEVSSVAFSRDGKRVLTGSHDGTARIWDSITGAPITPSLNVGAKLRATVFSPDNRIVATAADNGAVELWDSTTGQNIGKPGKHAGGAWTVSFSPDGKTLASGGFDWTARLWDVAKAAPIGEPLKHDREVWCVAFRPDGKVLASGSGDATVRLWDAHTGVAIGEPLKQTKPVWWLAFNPQGTALAAITPDQDSQQDAAAYLWDVCGPPRLLASLFQPGEVWAGAWSPNGTMIAMGSDDCRVRVRNAATGDLISQAFTHREPVMAVAFSPDGHTLATGSKDSTVRLWDISPVALPQELVHHGFIEAVVLSPDETTVFTGSSSTDHSGRFWDAVTGLEQQPLLHEGGRITAAAYSPDGHTLITGCMNGDLRLWDARSRQAICGRFGHEDRVISVEFSPDGSKVVTGSMDRTARIWNGRTGEPISPSLRHDDSLNRVAFSSTGMLVLTCSNDQTARLWDARTGRPRGKPLQHESPVMRGTFSPDGSCALTGCNNGTVRLWNTATGELVRLIRAHSARVNGVCFSPDGRRIVTASADTTARLWDITSGTMIGATMDHQGQVWALSFSPDGQMIATGGDDRQARLWDAWTGLPIGPALKHPWEITTLLFTRDARTLITGGFGPSARLWRVAGPVGGDFDQVEQWVHTLTGYQFTSGDIIRPIGVSTWRSYAHPPGPR